MSMPGNAVSSTPVAAALLPPDRLDRLLNLTVDYELGGVALNDPSQGLQVQAWEAWSDGTRVWVAPSPARVPAVLVLTGAGITEVSLAFDQNMAASLAYVEAGVTKMYWFDSAVPGMVVTAFAGASSPMITLDDKRGFSTRGGTSDILLFYLRAGGVYYRQQRDRFITERLMAIAVPPNSRIVAVGMGLNNRMQVWLSDFYGTAYTDLLTDMLYTVDTGQVVPLLAGAVQPGLWRSEVFSTNAHSSMAWARVEGNYPVTLRVYADGGLVAVLPPFASDDPVRLPAVRGTDWYVEVESTVGRAVRVTLASSLAELTGG